MIRENIEVTMPDNSLRKVRVALPDDYRESDEIYNVLYMFDGQNLFDEEDSFAGDIWNVHNALDRLVKEKKVRPLVIVGIDNGGDSRLDEYGPWPFKDEVYSSRGEGDAFADYFVQTLIPLLEDKYRISRESRGRAVAGSSMGALISAYIVTKYKEVFSSAGIFSLASWVSEEPFLKMLMEEGSYENTKFFVQVGTEETRLENGKPDYAASQRYISNSLNFIRAVLLKGGKIDHLSVNIGAGMTHNEGAWAGYMPEFLLWLNESMR